MYREIFIPTKENHTIEIPEEFYGKEVVIEVRKTMEETKADRLKRLEQSLQGYQVNLSDFKFDRNEANNYDCY